MATHEKCKKGILGHNSTNKAFKKGSHSCIAHKTTPICTNFDGSMMILAYNSHMGHFNGTKKLIVRKTDLKLKDSNHKHTRDVS